MLVIDNGSDTIKIGFSGEDSPRVFTFLYMVLLFIDCTSCYQCKIKRG